MSLQNKNALINHENSEAMRLNKFLSEASVCSRRQADVLIEKGEVTVNGVVAQMGTKVTKNDKVMLRGKEVKINQKLILLAVNKPKGIVCTTSKKDKDNIVDFIGYPTRIYPIGRLDKESEGLILMTNYGALSDKIARGINGHEKEYIVKVNKKITEDFLSQMRNGVPILDTVTRRCKVEKLAPYEFKIILTQGLNRQIRRMCEYLGYRVVALKRIRIMNIRLNHLKVGQYRNVTKEELETLKGLLGE